MTTGALTLHDEPAYVVIRCVTCGAIESQPGWDGEGRTAYADARERLRIEGWRWDPEAYDDGDDIDGECARCLDAAYHATLSDPRRI